MISKYPGKCRVCGLPYKAGDEIVWSKESGARHPDCIPDPPAGLFDESAEVLADRLGFRKQE